MKALPFISSNCYKCGIILENQKNICDFCETDISIAKFNKFITVFHYQKPISKLIKDFKYKNNILNGKVLSNILKDKILSCYSKDYNFPDVIIPVPSYGRKLKFRGYNQALEIARFLGKDLNLQVDTGFIIKSKETLSQVGLDSESRLHNLSDSFEIKSHKNYNHIAIVDDIVTTSSTILALNKIIKSNLLDVKIDIWCLAKKN